MNFLINIIILLILSFLSSCPAFDKSNGINKIEIQKENLKNIEGFYSNIPIKDNRFVLNQNYSSLWKKFKYYKKDTISNCEICKVELKVIDKQKIIVRIWSDTTLLKTKTISGRNKNGYFYTKRSVLPIGIPFVVFFWKNSQSRISLDVNKNLIIDRTYNEFGNILIFFAGNSYEYTERYSIIK
jgi:hypothetical protein